MFRSYPSRLILLVRSSQRFFVSTKMMVLFSFSAMISSISWISLTVRKEWRESTTQVSGLEDVFLLNKLFSYFSSFSVSMQTSTIWRMLWLALSSRAPTLIWIYSFRKSSASCRTSFGQVALHIRVCLSGWEVRKRTGLKRTSTLYTPFCHEINSFRTRVSFLPWFVRLSCGSGVQSPYPAYDQPHPEPDRCIAAGSFSRILRSQWGVQVWRYRSQLLNVAKRLRTQKHLYCT